MSRKYVISRMSIERTDFVANTDIEKTDFLFRKNSRVDCGHEAFVILQIDKKKWFCANNRFAALITDFCALYGLINFENRFRKFREQKVLLVITDSLDGRIGLFIG